MKISFRLNGASVSAIAPTGTETLLEYLRQDIGLCGTKEGCNEGDCGACSVIVTGKDLGIVTITNAGTLSIDIEKDIPKTKMKNKRMKRLRQLISQRIKKENLCLNLFQFSLIRSTKLEMNNYSIFIRSIIIKSNREIVLYHNMLNLLFH